VHRDERQEGWPRRNDLSRASVRGGAAALLALEQKMIDDCLHVSITCRDLEQSVRFYETLGLKVIKRLGEVKEDGIARGFRLAAGRLAVAYLARLRQAARCSSTSCSGWSRRLQVSRTQF